MTNEQLKAFLAVAEQGSFRKAAKTIFKTQAAVSASVKTLEDEYGFLLFDRESYRPQLTPAGQAFLHDAKLTVDQFERLGKIGHQLAKGAEPSFNIVISIAFPLPALLKKIKRIQDEFKYTQFRILTESLNGVVERIDDEVADLAFGPAIGINAEHERVPVADVTFINVAAPGYITESVESEISTEAIKQYSQIVIRDSSLHSDKASFYTTSARESWSINDFNTKKELVLAGLGWGSIPEHLIEKELANGELIPIDVEGIPTESSGALFMFRNRKHRYGPVASRFWNELKAAYED